MRRRSATLLALGATAFGGSVAPAGAQTATATPSKLLWATVNVCDTQDHPDTIGIRGSMPGTGVREQKMFMRFQLQFYDGSDKQWHNLGASGDSGFVDVGSAKFRRRQSGRNFTVTPPPTGSSYLLRGTVTFEWRLAGEVVKRARMRTSAGHGNTAGADPAGRSTASCTVAT